MAWLAVGGMVTGAVVALVVAARQGGAGWWRFVLGGAAGWVVAQLVKELLLAPVALSAVRHGGAAATAQLALQWWFVPVGALLPGVVEELGKYLPLRWLRVPARGPAIALGLGAGAVEALVLAVSVIPAAAGTHEGLAAALVAIWERCWAIAFHGGAAALDGLAVARGRIRWLVLAMALHTGTDLAAGWHAHAAAVGVRGGALLAPLVVAEVGVAAFALLTWWLGRRLWRAHPA